MTIFYFLSAVKCPILQRPTNGGLVPARCHDDQRGFNEFGLYIFVHSPYLDEPLYFELVKSGYFALGIFWCSALDIFGYFAVFRNFKFGRRILIFRSLFDLNDYFNLGVVY